MKSSKILAGICIMALVATLGIGAALAANTCDNTSDTSEWMKRRERILFTDEQKEEMEARRASMEASREQWTALTDEQKEEIYVLKVKAADIDRQIIDKYLGWDVFDAEIAAQIKERITEGTANMRESGRMPMPGGRGGHFRGGFRGAPTVP